MKKLIGIATLLVVALAPVAHAQGIPGHPDARNDRKAESAAVMHHTGKHHHHHHHHNAAK